MAAIDPAPGSKSQISDADFFSAIGSSYESTFAHDPGLEALITNATALLASLKPASILDAGCGTGFPTAVRLVDEGHTVRGIDISAQMVELSKARVPGGAFEVGNLLEWEPERSKGNGERQTEGVYDAVFALFSLFLMSREEIEMVCSKFGRWVKPGGLLFVATMAADDSKHQGIEAKWHSDRLSADNFCYKFMGIMQSMTLFTKEGWNKILERGIFEPFQASTAWFDPPEEAQCERYPHYYIIARRV